MPGSLTNCCFYCDKLVTELEAIVEGGTCGDWCLDDTVRGKLKSLIEEWRQT